MGPGAMCMKPHWAMEAYLGMCTDRSPVYVYIGLSGYVYIVLDSDVPAQLGLKAMALKFGLAFHGSCEGNTEKRPLIYTDTLRQGEPNRCDTLTQW